MSNIIKSTVFVIKRLLKENYKTIYFNFKYFSFETAIQFPVLVSKNVYFRELKGRIILDCPIRYGLVKIGYGRLGIFDEKHSRTILEISGELVFKGTASIGHGSKISVTADGKIVFGNGFIITAESSIVSFKKIVFGQNCLLSWDILIMDSDHHNIKDETGKVINAPEEIVIGDKVWIGCRALILKGSKIPSNSVIGASTVVNKTLDEGNSIYAGIPAKMIKKNISWD